MKYGIVTILGLLASMGLFERSAFADQNATEARYTTLGAIDNSTFHPPLGYLESTLTGADHTVDTLVDPSTGNIVFCGTYTDSSNKQHVLVSRVTATGNPDPGFGFGGVTTVSSSSFPQSVSKSCVRDSAGRIVLLFHDASFKNFLVRFLSNGAVDSVAGQFGFAGYATVTMSGPAQIRITSGDKIIIGGSNGTNYAASQFKANGVIDGNFGANGIAQSTVLGANAVGGSLAIDTLGRIVVGGTAVPNGVNISMGMVRFTAGGALDISQTASTILFPRAFVTSVVTDSTNRIYLAGGTLDAFGNSGAMAVTRLTEAGVVDGSFGSGMALQSFGNGVSVANAVKLMSNGDVVIAGSYSPTSQSHRAAIARLNTVFGSGVWNTTTLFSQTSSNYYGLTIDTADRPIAVGDSVP